MKIQDIHAIYINLEKDREKRNRIEKILKSLKIKNTRQDAVYGKNLENNIYRNTIAGKIGVPPVQMGIDFWMNRSNFKTMTKYQSAVLPKVGAYLSHLLAIKKAIDMKLDKVLILEDDIDPLENVNEKFNIPTNTDIFYLGGSFWKKNSLVDTGTPYISIDGDILKMVGGFAYIIPTREKMIEIYNVLMSVFNGGKGHDKHKDWRSGVPKMRAQAIDLMYVNHYQKNGNCYVVNPVRISHKELGSNIENNRKRYKIDHFLTDTHKNHIRPLFQ
tara:strand:+ start:622 stop:1440 length:819 start_codon:yes stop_codon:yes gene_type:complete